MSTLTLIFNPFTKQWRIELEDSFCTLHCLDWADACDHVCAFGMNYDRIIIEQHDPRYFPNGLTN